MPPPRAPKYCVTGGLCLPIIAMKYTLSTPQTFGATGATYYPIIQSTNNNIITPQMVVSNTKTCQVSLGNNPTGPYAGWPGYTYGYGINIATYTINSGIGAAIEITFRLPDTTQAQSFTLTITTSTQPFSTGAGITTFAVTDTTSTNITKSNTGIALQADNNGIGQSRFFTVNDSAISQGLAPTNGTYYRIVISWQSTTAMTFRPNTWYLSLSQITPQNVF